MKYFKELVVYFIVILIFAASLFTAIPNFYIQYITGSFLGILIYIILSTLTFIGIKKILEVLIVFIEMRNDTNKKSNIKNFYIKMVTCFGIGILIPLIAYFMFLQEAQYGISKNYYTVTLYFILSFLSLQGICGVLFSMKMNQMENEKELK